MDKVKKINILKYQCLGIIEVRGKTRLPLDLYKLSDIQEISIK